MERPRTSTRTKVLDRLVAQNFNFTATSAVDWHNSTEKSDRYEKAQRENLPQHSCWSGSENASRKRAETTPRAEHFTDHLLGRLKKQKSTTSDVRKLQRTNDNLRARIASEGQEAKGKANLERARAQGTSYFNTYSTYFNTSQLLNAQFWLVARTREFQLRRGHRQSFGTSRASRENFSANISYLSGAEKCVQDGRSEATPPAHYLGKA